MYIQRLQTHLEMWFDNIPRWCMMYTKEGRDIQIVHKHTHWYSIYTTQEVALHMYVRICNSNKFVRVSKGRFKAQNSPSIRGI